MAAADGDAALALAAGLNFQLLPISTAQRRVLAAELSAVCLGENGYSAVPAVRRALFADIEKASQEQENSAPELDPPPAGDQASATPWDQIKIGQLVLTQEDDPKHGWWEAIVLSELDDGEVVLRYRDYPTQSRFVRHRHKLALLKPA
ncbi:MAG: hypothetical protein ACJ8AI_30045 [Rhodopila sp.]